MRSQPRTGRSARGVVPEPRRGDLPPGAQEATGPAGDTGRLQVVVIARPTAANAHVFSRALQACRVQAALTDVPARKPVVPLRQRLTGLVTAPADTVVTPVRRKLLAGMEAWLDAQVAAQLSVGAASPFPVVERLTAAELNGERGATLLAEAAPDVLVLSGAPLLKPHIYRIPRLGTVNLHWGIAPNYRGQQSIFTALRRRDYGAIGVTMHYVDEGVDTGPVLAQGWPGIEPTDSLASIWAKTARLAGTMLTEFLEQAGHTPIEGTRLAGEGVNVRSKERRVWHHVRYAVDRVVLRRNPPRTEERIVRYW